MRLYPLTTAGTDRLLQKLSEIEQWRLDNADQRACVEDRQGCIDPEGAPVEFVA